MTTTFDELRLSDIVNKRILCRIKKIPPPEGIKGECWIFEGYTDKHGYGRLNVKRRKENFNKNFYCHRLVYVHYKGGIKDGTEIDHECNRRACCNPGHLNATTRQKNMHRRWYKHRAKGIELNLF